MYYSERYVASLTALLLRSYEGMIFLVLEKKVVPEHFKGTHCLGSVELVYKERFYKMNMVGKMFLK